jgi:hypothetical protein
MQQGSCLTKSVEEIAKVADKKKSRKGPRYLINAMHSSSNLVYEAAAIE